MRISKQRLKQIVREEFEREKLNQIIRRETRNIIIEQGWGDLWNSIRTSFVQGLRGGAAALGGGGAGVDGTNGSTAVNHGGEFNPATYCQNPLAEYDRLINGSRGLGNSKNMIITIRFNSDTTDEQINGLQQIVQNSINRFTAEDFSDEFLEFVRRGYLNACRQELNSSMAQQIQQRIPQILNIIRRDIVFVETANGGRLAPMENAKYRSFTYRVSESGAYSFLRSVNVTTSAGGGPAPAVDILKNHINNDVNNQFPRRLYIGGSSSPVSIELSE